jgi:hypothetical protein
MTQTPTLTQALTYALAELPRFSQHVIGRPLRPYQLESSAAILDSIQRDRGNTYVVEMARQAGKNEESAHIEAYLLALHQRAGGYLVKASPTFKPQTINSLNRLKTRLRSSPFFRGLWRASAGYIVIMGAAEAHFFSAEPTANVVGATASLLLECDEGQDVKPAKWEKDFAPMTASTNATIAMWGTAWTKDTLLAQTRHACSIAQKRDGRRRVFRYEADSIASLVPAYARHLAARIEKLGREHPLIKTQYFLEEIDARGGLFDSRRQALMRGTHERQREPTPGKSYAILIDVAGEDEQQKQAALMLDRDDLQNPRRDAIALTVVEIVPGEHTAYLVFDQELWIGVKHTTLYGVINARISHWRARWVVVDASGVGAGLASFLSERWKERVIPFEFGPATKSDLGWEFVGLVETGRFKMYADDQSAESRQFWYEVGACDYEVLDGPGNRIRWGVWDSPAYDGVVARGHDDLLISTAMAAIVDKQPAPTRFFVPTVITPDETKKQRTRRRGKF